MALSFDFTNVEDYSRIVDEDPNSIEFIVFETLFLGMNSITEENAGEFYARHKVYDGVSRYPTRREVTPAFIRQFIGLRTNASPLTETQFRTKVVKYAIDHHSLEYRLAVSRVIDDEASSS